MNTRVLALYLPQFHRVKENDEWWGEGFTDWVTAASAKPLFEGHNQPHIPLTEYDLLQKDSMKMQADLMRKYGVDGVCFYHYYFEDGRKILEKPAENLLLWKDINMPFCMYWANDSWIRSWENIEKGNMWAQKFDKKGGNESGILLKQRYGEKNDWTKHFYYLLPFFRDERYIKKEGKPIFIVLNPGDISCLKEMIECWNILAEKEGIQPIHFVGRDTDMGILDATLIQEPLYTKTKYFNERYNNIYGINYLLNYDDVWENVINNEINGENVYSCAFPDYDITPRQGKAGALTVGSTPEKFEYYFTRLLIKAIKNKNAFIFINAWNEWGEGMHLEPDVKWGYRYLDAIKNAKQFVGEHEKLLDKVIDDNKSSVAALVKNNRDNNKLVAYSNNTFILSKWLKRVVQGDLKLEMLLEKKVAIYGLGILGNALIDFLEANSIEVEYAIDRNVNKQSNYNFKVYSLISEDIPSVDYIIIALSYGIDEVRAKLLNNNIASEIITIDQLVNLI